MTPSRIFSAGRILAILLIGSVTGSIIPTHSSAPLSSALADTWVPSISYSELKSGPGGPTPTQSNFCLLAEARSVNVGAEGGATKALVQSAGSSSFQYLSPGTYTLSAGCYVHQVGDWVAGGGQIPKTRIMYMKKVEEGTKKSSTPKDHFYTTSSQERDNVLKSEPEARDEGVCCFVYSSKVEGTVPLYRLHNSRLDDHFYTTSLSERNRAASTLGYKDEGVCCYVKNSSPQLIVPLYRMIHKRNGDHFYTTSASERTNAFNKYDYKDEGVCCYVYSSQVAGTIPLFRLWSSRIANHLYTTSARERDKATSGIYKSEGTCCYVTSTQAEGTIPLYRLYKKSNGDHFYTTGVSERDNAVRNLGYVLEGTCCFVPAAAPPPSGSLVPMYRSIHKSNGDHFYTTSEREWRQAMHESGYLGEGICCEVYTKQEPGTTPLYRLYR